MTSDSESPKWSQPVPSLVGGTGRQLTAVLGRFEDLWQALDQRLAGFEAAQEQRHQTLLAQVQADRAEVISQISAHTDALRQEFSARLDEAKAAIAAGEAGVVSQISAHTDVLRREFSARLDEAEAAIAASETSVIGQISTHTDVLRQASNARLDETKAVITASETRVISQISNHTDVLRQELGGALTGVNARLDDTKLDLRFDQTRSAISTSETEVVHQISAHTDVLRRLIHSSVPSEARESPVEPATLISLTAALGEVKAQLSRPPPPFPLDALDETELSLLSAVERDTVPLTLEPSPPLIYRSAPVDTIETAHLEPPEPRYIDAKGDPVTIDDALPPLRLHQSNEDPLRPTFWADTLKPTNERRAYWFEFDTTPAFTSPNVWRSPILAMREGLLDARELAGEPMAPDRQNRAVNQGLTLSPLMTLDPFAANDSPVMRSPFRLSAMRLPTRRAALDWTEMQRQAMALGAGLPREALRREIFDYVRHVYGWSLDTRDRHGPETFMAGMGGCGHVANVAATYLELNGVRTRKVAGFNPKLRSVWAAAGHTALEVQEESGDWSYFDAYLGYYTPHISAKEIADGRGPYTLPYLTLPPRVAAKVGFELYELSKLFRYRIYFDTFARLPQVNAPRLAWREAAYAADLQPLAHETTWTADDLLPPSDKIHVRVRYAVGANALTYVGARFAATPGTARFSPWTTSSFPAPWATAKPRRRKAETPSSS